MGQTRSMPGWAEGCTWTFLLVGLRHLRQHRRHALGIMARHGVMRDVA